MISNLYSYYDLPYDHDFCHLLEHVVIREFLFELREQNHHRGLFGWLNGTTIDSSVFFAICVHNGEVLQLFERFMSNLHNLSESTINQSLSHIEAEMQAEITVSDKKNLKKQLEESLGIFQGKENIKLKYENLLTVNDTPDDFQHVAFVINVYDIPEDTRKAFLCLYPVLLDFVRDAAIDNEVAYPSGVSPLATLDEGIGIAQRFTVKKSLDLTQLHAKTVNYIEHLELSTASQQLDTYRQSFKTDTWYNDKPVQFYNETAIETTREELSRLATLNRLQEIIDKMTIRIEPVADKLQDIQWQ